MKPTPGAGFTKGLRLRLSQGLKSEPFVFAFVQGGFLGHVTLYFYSKYFSGNIYIPCLGHFIFEKMLYF